MKKAIGTRGEGSKGPVLSKSVKPWQAGTDDANVSKSLQDTPLKFNMEPKNHPTEKENHLNQTSIFRFHVKFQGSNHTQMDSTSIAEDLKISINISWLLNFFHALPFFFVLSLSHILPCQVILLKIPHCETKYTYE